MTRINPDRINQDPDRTWPSDDQPRPVPYRLEHLPPQKANKPDGRGTDTAAARGYDVERVAKYLFDGTRSDDSWYDVRLDADSRPGGNSICFLECKSCIDEYPCGITATFKIWKPHHYELLGCCGDSDNRQGRYLFLIYTVLDETAYEVGKFIVHPLVISELTDEWRDEHHTTMGHTKSREISWTRLTSALDITIDDLRKYTTRFKPTPRWAFIPSEDPP